MSKILLIMLIMSLFACSSAKKEPIKYGMDEDLLELWESCVVTYCTTDNVDEKAQLVNRLEMIAKEGQGSKITVGRGICVRYAAYEDVNKPITKVKARQMCLYE